MKLKNYKVNSLDIFVITMITEGMSAQSRQSKSQYQYFPSLYIDALVEQSWIEENIYQKITVDLPILTMVYLS